MLRIYSAPTDMPDASRVFGELYRIIPPERRQKADRFLFERDKRLSVGAWALLELALSREGISSREIRFGKNGKPYLADGGAFFNLSHSGCEVLCVISDTEVGCDVEQIAEKEDPAALTDIAEKFFAREEYFALTACPADRRTELFYRYWTLKESYIKALGTGLSLSPDSFTVILGEDITVRTSDGRGERYFFRQYLVREGYVCAVCRAERPISDTPIIRADLRDML